MSKSKLMTVGVVFFCTWGWICAGPAIGEEKPEAPSLFGEVDEASAQPAQSGAEDGSDEGSLFGDEESDDPSTGEDGQSVAVGSFGQIDLHVKDLEVTKVLQLLSIQSQRNIVASRNVAGSVSADLYNVDFYEAMDAILHSNGFGYREKGNFIYVYTSTELQTIADLEVRLIVKIVRLNYLPAADAVEFVKPLLSPAGSVTVSAAVAKGIQPTISDDGENSFAHQDTLMVRDNEQSVEAIMAVLQELDTRPKQVRIEATILEAQLDEDNNFGVDMTILADFNLADFGNPLSAVGSMLSGAVGGIGQGFETSVGNVSSGQSGVRVGFLANEVAVFIKALDQVTDTTVLANPKLLVLNRQRADLLVGERLGYISTTQTETSETQTVEFLDIGTQLTVRPFIGDDDFIRLELRPSISDGSTVAVAGFVIPNTTNEELVTNILVRNGQTVVMGGLFKEDTTITRRQVPVIGDIPIAGWAFRGQDDDYDRSEVIFLVKTTIVPDQNLIAEGDRVADSLGRIRIGARQGMLPWSRSKLVAAHMGRALEHAKGGNNDQALWSVNMALSLDPTFVEGLRLKEQLSGERVYWPNRSFMQDAINHAIDNRLGAEENTGLDELVGQPQEAAQQTAAEPFTATLMVPALPVEPVIDVLPAMEVQAQEPTDDEVSVSPAIDASEPIDEDDVEVMTLTSDTAEQEQ